MRRKAMLLLCIAAALTVFSGTAAYALGGIKLVVNGKTIQSDTPPQIVNGRAMLPVRAAAEALGAKVEWNGSEKRVTVDIPGQSDESTARQIQLLQDALAPESADDAVQKWAKFVKTRNGAAQYAMLSPTMKKQTRTTYEEMNWVTGVSSPWVDSYKISAGLPADNGRTNYEVSFRLKTSSGDAGGGTVLVTVGSNDENWLITGLQFKDGSDQLGGIVIVPTDAK